MGQQPRASLDELLEDWARQVERLGETRRALERVNATARHQDGLVTVVVGPRGQVQDIRFDPRVFRSLSPAELSLTVLTLIGEATAEVAGQMRDILAAHRGRAGRLGNFFYSFAYRSSMRGSEARPGGPPVSTICLRHA